MQPELGFYKHYKHDPTGEPFNYFYEVIGIARDTEDESLHVLYRPLYENSYLQPADFFSRPLHLFLEEVEVNGKRIPRFERITDPETLKSGFTPL